MKNWCVFSFGKCILLHVPYLLHAHSSSTLSSLFLSFAHLCITSFSLSQPAFFLLLFSLLSKTTRLLVCSPCGCKRGKNWQQLTYATFLAVLLHKHIIHSIYKWLCSCTSYPEGQSNPVLLSLYVEGGLETEWLWILHRCRDWEKCY